VERNRILISKALKVRFAAIQDNVEDLEDLDDWNIEDNESSSEEDEII